MNTVCPKRLKLNTKTNTLYGLPIEAGEYTFDIKVTGSLKASKVQTLTLVISQ